MRLFMFHPEAVFDEAELSDRTKITPKEVRKEMKRLSEASLVSSRSVIRIGKTRKKKVTGWMLRGDFVYLPELRQLLINSALITHSDVSKRIQKVGKIKLLILTGVFIQEYNDSKVDLLIVGDTLRRGALESAIKTLESEVGKEITYAAFETADFKYRYSMYDKLIRDILDFPHEKLINRLNI